MIGFENKTRIAVFLLIGVAATACATCLILAGIKQQEQSSTASNVSSSEVKPEPEPEPVATSARMKMLLAGTTFWGRRTNQLARASELGVKYPFSKLDTLKPDSYDAWIAGLECPLVQKENNEHNYAEENNSFIFNCDPDYLSEAKKYFTAFLLGNNHTDNQGGGVGLTETRKHLSDAGIQYFGTPKYSGVVQSEQTRDTAEAENCDIVVLPINVTYDNKKTKKIQMPFGFCSAHGVFGVPGSDYIDNMKKYATYVPTIAMPHMGAEYQPSHDELRQNLYRRMIDYAGVESVIADHPHWVQDAEAYNNKLIVYSMGNFMFDQYSGGEYSRSAAIEANADINVKDVDFDKWDDLGKACLKDKISCLEKIQNAKLTRLSVDWKYDYHATTSAGDCITRMADANEQNAVGQRLRWSTIPASLKVEK